MMTSAAKLPRPFEATEEAGHIFGRGTADMKGFVAAALNVRLAAGL